MPPRGGEAMSPKRRVYWVGEDGETHDVPLEDTDPLPKVGDVVNLTGEPLHRIVEIDRGNEPDTYELVVEPVEKA
jgi:hypothetical protein